MLYIVLYRRGLQSTALEEALKDPLTLKDADEEEQLENGAVEAQKIRKKVVKVKEAKPSTDVVVRGLPMPKRK